MTRQQHEPGAPAEKGIKVTPESLNRAMTSLERDAEAGRLAATYAATMTAQLEALAAAIEEAKEALVDALPAWFHRLVLRPVRWLADVIEEHVRIDMEELDRTLDVAMVIMLASATFVVVVALLIATK